MRDQPRLATPQPKPRRQGKDGVAGAKTGPAGKPCARGGPAEELPPPHPALVDLVRALARAAAREHHAAMTARTAGRTEARDNRNDGA